MADFDYYQALGLSKGASKDAIRKAYKKLVRENHPDARPDDPSAAERFKQIQEAYDVLSDDKKRELYDRFGKDYEHAARAAAAGANPFGGGPGGGGAAGFSPFSGSGPIDLGDLFGQGVDFSEFFGGGGSRRGKRGPARGADLKATVKVPFETAVTGGRVDVVVGRQGTTETLAVKVPAGVNEGQVVRLSGQGEPAARSGMPGDLFLTIEIEPHPYFRREGLNLLLDAPITPSEAVLGAKIEVPTLTAGRGVVTVPAGTSSGAKLRLRGKGIVDSKTNQTGDQFVVIKIVVPKTISDADKALYQTLAANETSPRTGLW
jgi:curved DNA-binding protein